VSNKLLESALWYQKQGYSVIPIRQNKKPYLKEWKLYQTEKADPGMVRAWWKKWPDANIGLVAGRGSGRIVVDVDSQKGLDALNEFLTDSLITPIAETPGGGWHYYFKYQPGLTNRARVITDCDVRTDGGYIIAPPSIGENGKGYAWMKGLSVADVDSAAMPDMLFDILQQGGHAKQASPSEYINITNMHLIGGSSLPDDLTCPQMSSNVLKLFEKGSRNETLFHVANCLVKGGMNKDMLLNVLSFIAERCDPPFPQKDVFVKLESALKRSESRERNLTQEIRDFVLSSNGLFLSSEIHNCLHLSSRQEKKNVSNTLARLIDEGIIERSGNRNGQFRRIDIEVEKMDFLNAENETVDLWLPFDLHEKAEIMPGNIIVIAGSPDAGKTGFLLNVIRENLRKFEIHYFNSEMGSSELKKRLNNFDDMTLGMWKFKAWERSDNFADVIKPGKGKVNIIDFLELHDNFYEVGGKLAEIHKKLKGAVALVALQKNPGVKMGLGGFRSAEKPRLYLSMDSGLITIQKCKNWATSENPNGLQYKFKVVGGCKFIKVQGWHKPIKT